MMDEDPLVTETAERVAGILAARRLMDALNAPDQEAQALRLSRFAQGCSCRIHTEARRILADFGRRLVNYFSKQEE